MAQDASAPVALTRVKLASSMDCIEVDSGCEHLGPSSRASQFSQETPKPQPLKRTKTPKP